MAGPNVAQGYWRNPEATASGIPGADPGEEAEPLAAHRRLGFLDEAGELYITGRIKDLIIIRGANHYPQDIETTVQECHRRCDSTAAPPLASPTETTRSSWSSFRRSKPATAAARCRGDRRVGPEAIILEHSTSAAREVVLISDLTGWGKTTSGKIQRRRLARQALPRRLPALFPNLLLLVRSVLAPAKPVQGPLRLVPWAPVRAHAVREYFSPAESSLEGEQVRRTGWAQGWWFRAAAACSEVQG